MLQKLQGWLTRVNLALMQLTFFEQGVIVGGCAAVAVLCLLMPTMVLALIKLVGFAAVCVGGYTLYHLSERQEARDADYE
jgi:NAD/NADP transhydrogenase beta subunit